MNKYAGYVAIIALLVALVGLTLPAAQEGETTQKIVERVVGAGAGTTDTEFQQFYGNLSKGNGYYATSSTASSYTLTSGEMKKETNLISWTPNVSTTLTTMASTSAPFSDLKAGEEYSVNIYNASTTAAATITLAAGTGVDLQEDEGSTVIINGLEIARLTFLKKADSDVIAWVEVGQVGD